MLIQDSNFDSIRISAISCVIQSSLLQSACLFVIQCYILWVFMHWNIHSNTLPVWIPALNSNRKFVSTVTLLLPGTQDDITPLDSTFIPLHSESWEQMAAHSITFRQTKMASQVTLTTPRGVIFRNTVLLGLAPWTARMNRQKNRLIHMASCQWCHMSITRASWRLTYVTTRLFNSFPC